MAHRPNAVGQRLHRGAEARHRRRRHTGTDLTEGCLDSAEALYLTVESDRLVAFGDGIEPDAISLAWGQAVRIQVAEKRLRLVR